MGLVTWVGSVAAACTTVAFVPQIVKIRRQGGEDLSYNMLFLYLTGILLWLVYGLMVHSAPIIWANGVTAFLVAVALVLKVAHAGQRADGRR
jgi:MtN3 and saliva related transmembrane protein